MTRSAQIIAFPPPKTPAAPCAAALEDVPPSGVAAPFRQWLDPASLRAVADDRPDMGEWLRSRAVPEPSLGGKLLVALIVAACSLYCIAIWVGAL